MAVLPANGSAAFAGQPGSCASARRGRGLPLPQSLAPSGGRGRWLPHTPAGEGGRGRAQEVGGREGRTEDGVLGSGTQSYPRGVSPGLHGMMWGSCQQVFPPSL